MKDPRKLARRLWDAATDAEDAAGIVPPHTFTTAEEAGRWSEITDQTADDLAGVVKRLRALTDDLSVLEQELQEEERTAS